MILNQQPKKSHFLLKILLLQKNNQFIKQDIRDKFIVKDNIYTWHSYEREYVAGLAESFDDSKAFLLNNLSKIEEMIINNALNDKKWLDSISEA